MDFMFMAMRIQFLETSHLYDFIAYIEDKLHESLLAAKDLMEILKFKHHYLICHIIIFQNRTKWDNALKIKKFYQRTKERWSIQRWTQI